MLESDSLQQFQRNSWQKEPTVFHRFFDPSSYPLTQRQLCELSTKDIIESRMISADHELLHGPFDLQEISDHPLIPEEHLLLVQCLEQHIESINAFCRSEFDFIPGWQVDDVMASVGDTGASCGAHFDHYDVFLAQHTGSKTWLLDDGGHTDDALDDTAEIRLLRTFSPTQTHIIEAGDVLYVPAGIGHFGTCDNSGITLSVGIRNPTTYELLSDLSEFLISTTQIAEPMIADLHSGHIELPESVLENLSGSLSKMMSPSALLRWYGSYVTRLRDPDVLTLRSAALTKPLTKIEGMRLKGALPSRMSYAESDGLLLLFINGDCFELSADQQQWIHTLCQGNEANVPDKIDSRTALCLKTLLEEGALLVAATNE